MWMDPVHAVSLLISLGYYGDFCAAISVPARVVHACGSFERTHPLARLFSSTLGMACSHGHFLRASPAVAAGSHHALSEYSCSFSSFMVWVPKLFRLPLVPHFTHASALWCTLRLTRTGWHPGPIASLNQVQWSTFNINVQMLPPEYSVHSCLGHHVLVDKAESTTILLTKRSRILE